MTTLPFLDHDAVLAALRPGAAVEAIVAALCDGLDPSFGVDRATVPLAADGAHLLLMPAVTAGAAAVKVLSVAPGNPAAGLPRIQGVCLLLDGTTYAPVAVLDGAGLTTRRTPAVSVAAVAARLAASGHPVDVVVLGTGPQAIEHVTTLADVLAPSPGLGAVTLVARTPRDLVLPTWPCASVRVLVQGDDGVGDALAAADVVVCATTARTPVVTEGGVRDDAVVIAVGSHELDAWELDPALLLRATVVVEDVGTAMREAGDVVEAVARGLDPAGLLTIGDLVSGRAEAPADRPLVVRTVGMAWEDLVVARAVHESWFTEGGAQR